MTCIVNSYCIKRCVIIIAAFLASLGASGGRAQSPLDGRLVLRRGGTLEGVGANPQQIPSFTTWQATSETGESSSPRIIAPHVRAPLTDAVRGVAAANNQFAFDLFGQMRAGGGVEKNLLISPLSISTALSMTYAGARGHNARQMAEVLHLDGLGDDAHAGYGGLIADLNAPREGYDLSVVNRLFGQEGFLFHDAFLDQLATEYRSPMERLDFINSPDPSRIHINRWVSDQTNQRIKDLLPAGSVKPDTRLVLTNAVYFNGAWKYEFDEDSTRDAPFYLGNGAVSPTSMMYQQKVFNFGQFVDFQMLELPYAGDDLSMVLMLPNERGGLAALEESLTQEGFNESIESLTLRQVEVYLPKFTFKDGAKLKDSLAELGMTDAFDGGNFSAISDVPLEINEVYHKTYIDVDETGTEAAAATAVVIVTTTSIGPPPPPPVFRADHPFLFALRDTHTGSLLFLGRMANPGAATAASVPEPAAAALALVGLVAVAFLRRRGRP